jgi:hypothetical protein
MFGRPLVGLALQITEALPMQFERSKKPTWRAPMAMFDGSLD